MKWSFAGELLDTHLGAQSTGRVGERNSFACSGKRDLSSFSLLSSAADSSAALCETGARRAGRPRRAMRTYLPQCSRDVQPATNLYPFSRNAGAADLQSEWPAALHPWRKLPSNKSRHRGISSFNNT